MSLKDERNIGQMGIVNEKSTVANRTASEYVARLLIKTEGVVQQALDRQEFRCVNLCMDAASFAGEQVLSVSFLNACRVLY